MKNNIYDQFQLMGTIENNQNFKTKTNKNKTLIKEKIIEIKNQN